MFRRVMILAMLSAVLPLHACMPPGRRLLHVTVQQGETVVLSTAYEDGGRADVATVWAALGTEPIMVVKESTQVDTDPDDPLRATLDGTVLVRISHAGDLIAEARVTGLVLMRTDRESDRWFLTPEEVKRTAPRGSR